MSISPKISELDEIDELLHPSKHCSEFNQFYFSGCDLLVSIIKLPADNGNFLIFSA